MIMFKARGTKRLHGSPMFGGRHVAILLPDVASCDAILTERKAQQRLARFPTALSKIQ